MFESPAGSIFQHITNISTKGMMQSIYPVSWLVIVCKNGVHKKSLKSNCKQEQICSGSPAANL